MDIGPSILVSCASALYKPLRHLFKTSLKYGVVPEQWHMHKIIPIFKSGDPCSVRNYRPISLLSNTSKVLEHLIYDKIIDHISSFISSTQYGFLKKKSSLQQLLIFLKYIYSTQSQTDVLYFDIKKAFDTVSHDKLLYELWINGINGSNLA